MRKPTLLGGIEQMGFVDAIKSGIANYTNFSGRASRSELWFWILGYVIAAFAVGIITAVIGNAGNILLGLLVLAVIVPTISLEVRRLHDLDKSGWWIFISLVPLVGSILLIVWFCTQGTSGPNRFGSNPLPL